MHLIFTVLQLNLIQRYLLINDNSLAHSHIIEVYLQLDINEETMYFVVISNSFFEEK